jgi:glycosyltransferase involved in cell wall biosynthesis
VKEPTAPAVSVLLPAFNAALTLPACLASLHRQTLADWECVLVDDGSTDATPEVAVEAAKDARVRVLTTTHRGLLPALRHGLAACRGRVVARMDADDLMHRDRLRVQLQALNHDATLAAVGCQVRIFPRATLAQGRRDYEAWLNAIDSPEAVAREAFVECPLAHPTLAVRRHVLEAFGYPDGDWPEDYDLILRLLAAGHRIGTVPRRLLAWRDSPDRLSRTDARYGLDRFAACKAYHLARGFLAHADRYVLWGYGGTGRSLRRALALHGRRPSHIVEIKRTRLGQHIHGAPVIAPEELSALRGVPIVVSVAFAAPRNEIRQALRAMQFEEVRDFVCAA